MNRNPMLSDQPQSERELDAMAKRVRAQIKLAQPLEKSQAVIVQEILEAQIAARLAQERGEFTEAQLAAIGKVCREILGQERADMDKLKRDLIQMMSALMKEFPQLRTLLNAAVKD